jgi:signal transduction histidine kinase
MNIDWVLRNPNDASIIDKLQFTHQGLDNAVVELREISHHLQPAFFGNKQLSAAIKEFAEQLNLKQNCVFEVYVEDTLESMNANLKLNCYRIVTELMQNIIKHAKATNASVQVINNDNQIQMIIDDNGIGFNVMQTSDGIGLLNIKNRVEVCKGKINIDSSSSGTSIIIDLPFK